MQNVIERAVILCGDSGLIEPEHLGFTPSRVLSPASPPPAASASPAQATGGESGNLASGDGVLSLAEMEKRHILAALQQTGQNRTHAAKVLGISVRTLRNKLSEYGVTSKEETSEPAEKA